MGVTKAITKSGRIVDLLNPQPETISAQDVAWHLGHEIRWNGQLGELSVAQHSIEVAKIVEPVTTLTPLLALLHDGEEYLYGDVVSPAKEAITRLSDAWDHQTSKLQEAIYFALAGRLPTKEEQEAIDVADHTVAKWEAWIFGETHWKDAIERIAPAYFDGCREAKIRPKMVLTPMHASAHNWLREYEGLKRGPK